MGVLDDMTKGITERKAAATGPKLTPVGVESSPTKPSLPNDVPGVFMSNEQLHTHSLELRKFAADAIAIADGIDLMVGPGVIGEFAITPDPKKAAAEEKKVKEQAGDAKFAEHLATISAEAKAAVFTSADAPAEEPAAPAVTPVSDWVCPDHGSEALKQLTSRAKRVYMACQAVGCKQYEKESQ